MVRGGETSRSSSLLFIVFLRVTGFWSLCRLSLQSQRVLVSASQHPTLQLLLCFFHLENIPQQTCSERLTTGRELFFKGMGALSTSPGLPFHPRALKRTDLTSFPLPHHLFPAFELRDWDRCSTLFADILIFLPKDAEKNITLLALGLVWTWLLFYPSTISPSFSVKMLARPR